MKSIIVLVALWGLFQGGGGRRIEHTKKAKKGSGTYNASASYTHRVNVDSLILIYDTVKVATKYGVIIYVQ